MTTTINLSLVFDLLKNKKKPLMFNEIWEYIKKDINYNQEDERQVASDLYASLVLDNRFSLSLDKLWSLRNVESDKNNLKTLYSKSLEDFEKTKSTLLDEDEIDENLYNDFSDPEDETEEKIICEDDYDN